MKQSLTVRFHRHGHVNRQSPGLRPALPFYALTAALLHLFATPGAANCEQAGDVRSAGSWAAYRGINLTLRTNPTGADVQKLDGWGVNTVRVVIHADPQGTNNDGLYLADGKTIDDKAYLKLDRLVNSLAERKVGIILCLFDFPGERSGGIWKDYNYWDQLVALWSGIATRYRMNPLVIGYDLMNEPSLVRKEGTALDRILVQSGAWSFPDRWLSTPRDYFALMERIGKTINEISPDKRVIVEGIGLWGHPDNFRWMRPVKVNNVMYSFHMYVPHSFTDSGKNGRALEEYAGEKDRARVIKAMAPVETFAKRNNAAVFVGELGLSYHSEGRGAAQWLRDVLGYLEQRGWGWTYWTYSIPFRNPEVVRKPDGSLDRRGETERLNVLKEYWKGRETPTPDTAPERRTRP